MAILGKTFTAEHRAKISAAKKGRPLTEEHKQALRQANRYQVGRSGRRCVFKGIEYLRVKDAAIANNVTTSNVIYYLKSDSHPDSYYIDRGQEE